MRTSANPTVGISAKRLSFCVFFGALTVTAAGCAGLSFGKGAKGIGVEAPNVTIAAVRLAQAPSNKALASYYCAQYLSPIVCKVFGPVPEISETTFAFDVELALDNPNPVPLPLVQSLFAFTAYPDEGESGSLGTVCLSFCENPERCEEDASACISDDPDIRDAEDFTRAAAGFLYSVALGERGFQDLRVRTVPPNDQTRVVVRLGIDPTQMVDLIRRLAKGDIDRIKHGELPKLAIPYQLEGTAWVAVEGFGRLGTGFGPTRGEWALRER
jgi:hypothetical protein